MQKDLRRFASALRQETCPRRVIVGAGQKIAAQKSLSAPLRYSLPFALAGAALLGALLLRSHLTGGNTRHQAKLAAQQARQVQLARQTETALGLIGAVLLDARAHSENAISDHAIPPLRNGLQTARNKLLRHTEL